MAKKKLKLRLNLKFYASSHCTTRSNSLPKQHTEEQYGGGGGALETRISQWVAQALKGDFN